jgi:hypothetical protein
VLESGELRICESIVRILLPKACKLAEICQLISLGPVVPKPRFRPISHTLGQIKMALQNMPTLAPMREP